MLPLSCQVARYVGKGAMDSASQPQHMSRRDAADAMRSKLLESAARILASEGISGLTARKLSSAADASTKVVYNHFGGMPGVVAALYDRGFALLAAQLSKAVELAKPGQNVAAIADAYRAFALGNPDLFDLMYGPSVAILLPTPDTRANASLALDVLIGAFSESGELIAKDRARAFWAAMHGVTALERTGWFDDDEAQRRLSEVIAVFEMADH